MPIGGVGTPLLKVLAGGSIHADEQVARRRSASQRTRSLFVHQLSKLRKRVAMPVWRSALLE
jgi:hypothetical protein